jgi:hypothetical protein
MDSMTCEFEQRHQEGSWLNLMRSYVVYGQKPKLGNDVEQQLAEDHDLP